MTTNYLKQIVFLNFIAIPALILFFAVIALSNPEKLMLFIALPGFFIAFFIFKESSFTRYIGLIFFNSLFFGFLFTLVFYFCPVGPFQPSSSGPLFLPFFIFFSGSCSFFGGLVSIIPKSFIERLKIGK